MNGFSSNISVREIIVEPSSETEAVFAQVRNACELEATAIKAGNVHPHAAFNDMSYRDFFESASVLENVWQGNPQATIGEWILGAVEATQHSIGKNSNLGIILLLAPLAKAAQYADQENDRSSLPTHRVLGELTPLDARQVYQAIRLAKPGGLGSTPSHDVNDSQPDDLVMAMHSAAHRDDIARQYATNFSDVYELATKLTIAAGRKPSDSSSLSTVAAGRKPSGPSSLSTVADGRKPSGPSSLSTVAEGRKPSGSSSFNILDCIARLQIEYLAQRYDSLILRKCGASIAEEVRCRASELFLLQTNSQATCEYISQWHNFDTFLRSDGHRLNPGTTADLLAAATFVYLFQNRTVYELSPIPR